MTKTTGTLAKVEIRNIPSQYSDGIATVSLRLTYRNLDTRLALAAGHRITANLLEALEAHMGNSAWCAPQVEEVTSYRNIAEIAVNRRGDVRRAKLYYLRDRSGKSARIKEKLPAKKTAA